MSDEKKTQDEDVELEFGHIVPDEYGGGFCYIVHMKGGAQARAIDPRNFKQMLAEWLERKKGVLQFQGTVDESGDGSAVFESSEIACIRYAALDDGVPWVSTDEDDKDDDEDEDDEEEGGGQDEDDPAAKKVTSLADFKS